VNNGDWPEETFWLSGEQQANCVSIFADEAKPSKDCKWLLIGYLLVPTQKVELAYRQLREVRTQQCYMKEIHFNELDNHSESPHGQKTALAKRWLNLFASDSNNTWHFHLNAINISILNPAAFGHEREDDTIYNRFFRSGLLYVLKRCFDLPIYVDSIYHHETHMENDPYFKWHVIHKFNETQPSISYANEFIEFVGSDHNDPRCTNQVAAEFLQMTDLILGSFRQCFFVTSHKAGKNELAQVVYPILERITDPKRRNNPNSSYCHYRRVSVGFFPSRPLSICELQDELKRAESKFYYNEPLRIGQSGQQTFDLW
jgi:hypothetical protein